MSLEYSTTAAPASRAALSLSCICAAARTSRPRVGFSTYDGARELRILEGELSS
jgi:hypothetical protein